MIFATEKLALDFFMLILMASSTRTRSRNKYFIIIICCFCFTASAILEIRTANQIALNNKALNYSGTFITRILPRFIQIMQLNHADSKPLVERLSQEKRIDC